MATILLIDDEPSIRLLYADVLADEGHEVVEAECGSEALKVIGKIFPDLVLLDLKLRGENGLNLLEEILGRYPDLPIIILTAFVPFQDNYLCWLADACVGKSADPSDLLREVNRVLEKEKTRQPSTGGQGR